MTPQQRKLQRTTAIIIFITAFLGLILIFSLVLLFDVGPNLWHLTEPDNPRTENMTNAQRPLYFVLIFTFFTFTQLMILFSSRLMVMCLVPKEWVIYHQALQVLWQVWLLAMLVSHGTFYVSFFFPEEGEFLLYYRYANQFFYTLFQASVSATLLAIGIGSWWRGHAPRWIFLLAVLLSGGMLVLSPLQANPDSFIFQNQPQQSIHMVVLVIFGAYLLLTSRVPAQGGR